MVGFPALYDAIKKHDLVIAYLLGSKKAKDELSPLSDSHKLPLGGPIQAFKMLKLGRVHAYLAGPGIVNRDIYNKKFKDSHIEELGIFARFPLYPYLYKKHEKIIPVLEAALKSMVEDDSLKNIRRSLEAN